MRKRIVYVLAVALFVAGLMAAVVVTAHSSHASTGTHTETDGKTTRTVHDCDPNCVNQPCGDNQGHHGHDITNPKPPCKPETTTQGTTTGKTTTSETTTGHTTTARTTTQVTTTVHSTTTVPSPPPPAQTVTNNTTTTVYVSTTTASPPSPPVTTTVTKTVQVKSPGKPTVIIRRKKVVIVHTKTVKPKLPEHPKPAFTK